ncbi:pancreatic triacylglycerol lipase-like [Rhinatrema bivittatum]|uniref:pancreatic triacylglycerol lipase-like n=1 Tax=Rhinatrema bivittatum TaxID=194408 RepID=UPI00112A5295|nr:pancreatic triacylglycerol lipase-like [Rhinatrema bivittatum]XP_029466340.1 pancreatic triacylglycerol lipase-like [Rhinatrema bivittatum]
MLGVWIFALFLLGTVRGDEVCYDRLGCFTNNIPWAGTAERPIARLPWTPGKINTRLLLYTRENPNNFQEITAINPSTILASNFKTNRKTRFITHGFVDKGEENWLHDMCKRMLQVEDVNCICVDWKGGSLCSYTQAANNIRVVGAEVAYFIDTLKDNYGYSAANVHFIGHSLGAHAAAETGRRVRGLARITGLDPAEPYFQSTPKEVRLDISDATFVDVIHTDAAPIIPNLGFGMSQAVGHLDFYPNGGEEMPGCQKNVISQIVDIDGIWEGTRDFVACNHLRSYKYYSDSILSQNGFIGYPSPTYESFKSGTGFPCPSGGCPRMGHYADNFHGVTTVSQKFYLNTGDAKEFSRWRYMVTVTISGSFSVRGYFNIALYGSNGVTRQHQIFKGSISPGKTYTAYIDVEADVGTLNKVKFLWNNNILNPLLPKFGAQTVTVQFGGDGTKSSFCGSETVREDILQTLNLC